MTNCEYCGADLGVCHHCGRINTTSVCDETDLPPFTPEEAAMIGTLKRRRDHLCTVLDKSDNAPVPLLYMRAEFKALDWIIKEMEG